MAPGSATTPRPGGRPTRCWRNASRWTRGTRQAWARLGRLQRVRAKYGDEAEDTTLAWARAESSLTRAAELNPDLSLAHGQLALLELDLGRTEDALTRLLTRAAIRPRDPDLFVGLVQVCRSAGLLEASVAAHHVARRLDPRIPTSVIHTFWMLGHYARALDAAEHATDPIKGLVLALLGRPEEALGLLRVEAERFVLARMQLFVRASMAAVAGDRDQFEAAALRAVAIGIRDPESVFHIGRLFVRAGDPGTGLDLLERAVGGGFSCPSVLTTDPWLAPLRQEARFHALLGSAQARAAHLTQLFVEHGGERLLGAAGRRADPTTRN